MTKLSTLLVALLMSTSAMAGTYENASTKLLICNKLGQQAQHSAKARNGSKNLEADLKKTIGKIADGAQLAMSNAASQEASAKIAMGTLIIVDVVSNYWFEPTITPQAFYQTTWARCMDHM